MENLTLTASEMFEDDLGKYSPTKDSELNDESTLVSSKLSMATKAFSIRNSSTEMLNVLLFSSVNMIKSISIRNCSQNMNIKAISAEKKRLKSFSFRVSAKEKD